MGQCNVAAHLLVFVSGKSTTLYNVMLPCVFTGYALLRINKGYCNVIHVVSLKL